MVRDAVISQSINPNQIREYGISVYDDPFDSNRTFCKWLIGAVNVATTYGKDVDDDIEKQKVSSVYNTGQAFRSRARGAHTEVEHRLAVSEGHFTGNYRSTCG